MMTMRGKLPRRTFLKGTLATGALLSARIPAPAEAQGSGFRALICIQQSGGCDNFLFSIPTDALRRNALVARRGPHATSYYSDPDLFHLGYGTNVALHPKLKPLQPYLQKLRLTLGVANAMHVPNSGSHEIQQIRMSLGTEISAQGTAGWKARLFDSTNARLMGFNGARSQDFACTSPRCQEHPPLITNTFGEYRLDGASFNTNTQGGQLNAQHANMIIEQIANAAGESSEANVQRFRSAQRGMLAATQDVTYTLNNFVTPNYASYEALFAPNQDYAGYLTAIRFRDIAQLMKRMRDEGSTDRIIITVPHGGYDTHGTFQSSTYWLMNHLGKILRAFLDDLSMMGILNQVVIHTETEFGRQIATNGASISDGTDHGTAFSTLTIGGRVRGGSNVLWGEMISPQLLSTEYGWPRVIDSRAIIAEIIERHLGYNPMTTAFPGAIGQEFQRVSLSLFS